MGLRAAVHHSLSPLAPEFLVPLVSPSRQLCLSKLLPWHFLTNRQNLFHALSFYAHLSRAFAFIMCFLPSFSLDPHKHPKWDRRERIIIPILQERKLRLPFWFSSVVSEHLRGSQPHTGPAVSLTISRFSLFFLSHISHNPSGFYMQAHNKYSWSSVG